MRALFNEIHRQTLVDEENAGRIVWPDPRAGDPLWFFPTILGRSLWSAQVRWSDAKKKGDRLRLVSGRRTGKSFWLAGSLLGDFCAYPDATCIMLAPTERQVSEILWQDVRELFHNSGRCLSCKLRDPDGPRPCPHSACIDGELSASVRTGLRSGDRRLFGMSPRSPDHVRGLSGQHQRYGMDDSSGIGDDIAEQVDNNCAGGGQIIATGQPSNPVGWFMRAAEDNKHWIHEHTSSLESPNIRLHRIIVPSLATEEWATRKRDELGEEHPAYRCEILGLPPSQDSRRLLSEVDYAGAVERNKTLPIDGEPFVLAIDPASGAEDGDASTIAMRRGWRMWPVLSFHGGTDRIVLELQGLIRTHRRYTHEVVWLNFDCEGAPGAALRIALNEMRRRDDFLKVVPLESGRGGAEDAHLLRRAGVYDRRALYWWCACERLKTIAGIVHDEELREELLFPYFEADQSRGSRLPDKRKYRKQFSRSPDKADATVYCLFDGELPATSQLGAEAAQRAAAVAPPPRAPEPRSPIEAAAQMTRGIHGSLDWIDPRRQRASRSLCPNCRAFPCRCNRGSGLVG